MRNLKKLLALVLALMMVVSVMVTVNAASTDDYSAAVKALQNYGVLEGYEDGQIHADNAITRADMAAIIYRIMTGDTAGGAEKNAALATKYGSYASKFSDAKEAPWALGYIGWCANKGVLKGYGNGKVQPNEKITGYEVQAMLLRALGYDMNNEYTGSDWEYKVLSDATKTAINKGVSTDPAKATPRGAVAQLTYNAAVKAWRVAVTFAPTVGYNPTKEHLIEVGTATLSHDVWGVPTSSYTLTYTWPTNDVTVPKTTSYTPLVYWDAVTECDVAYDMGFDGTATAVTYTNGVKNEGKAEITATDTVNTIGHEGRYTALYDTNADKKPDYIVYKDTYLAEVTQVIDKVVDPNGHVLVPASVKAKVYSNDAAVGNSLGATHCVVLTVPGSYNVGDVLYVNVVNVPDKTALNTLAATGSNTNYDPAKTGSQVEVAAVAPKTTVTVKTITKDTDTTPGGTAQRNVGFTTTTGAQYYYNYTFAGTVLDGTAINKSYDVWTDSQGNVLKIAPAATESGVGVVLSSKVVEVSTKEAYIEYTILKANGEQVTINGGDATGKPFASKTAAETALRGDRQDGTHTSNYRVIGKDDELVKFESAGKYYKVLTAKAWGNTSSGAANALIEAGNAEALKKVNNGGCDHMYDLLVDDETVFFIATYGPDNTTENIKDDYKFEKYDIKKGFKNIDDLGIEVGARLGGTVTNHLAVSALILDDNGNIITPNYTTQHADYVLVLNSTKQTKNEKGDVLNYAFLTDNSVFTQMGESAYTFPALIDGKSSSLTMKLNNAASIKTVGLYSYKSYANGDTNDELVLLTTGNSVDSKDHKIAKDTYTYAAGVLTAYTSGSVSKKTGAAPTYYTVADGCKVFLVNPTTGECTNATLGSLATNVYGQKSDIWYQLDGYGYISLIYIVDDNPTPQTVKKTSFSASGGTATYTSGKLTVNGVTITMTSNEYTGINAWANAKGIDTARVSSSFVIEQSLSTGGWQVVMSATKGNSPGLATASSTKTVDFEISRTLAPGNYRATVTLTMPDGTSQDIVVTFGV